LSETKRTEAQRRAEKVYNVTRLKKPSIPAIRLNNDEKKWTDEVFNTMEGTKKRAVLEGLKLLKNKLNKSC
jgi:hypothetical protein